MSHDYRVYYDFTILPLLLRMRKVPMGFPGNSNCLLASLRSRSNHHLAKKGNIIYARLLVDACTYHDIKYTRCRGLPRTKISIYEQCPDESLPFSTRPHVELIQLNPR